MWAQDDIATPDELAAWLRARGLLGESAAVDAESFLRARALRGLLRELARRNGDRDSRVDPALRAEFAAAVAATRLRLELDEGGALRLEPDADGVDGALARSSCGFSRLRRRAPGGG